MISVSIALVLVACGQVVPAPASTDAGIRDGAAAEDDAGPPAFEVRLEHSMDRPIEAGDSLPVEYGCQGGAHINLDVVALGAALDEATLEVREGDREPLRLLMTPRAGGAEYRFATYVLEPFVSPGGLGLPRDTILSATVTRADGTSVTATRSVRLIDGYVCELVCSYVDTYGTAHITAVEAPPPSACAPESISLTFDFVGEDTFETGALASDTVPPECLEALGLVVGGEVPMLRRALLPGTGTCSPLVYELDLDRTPCATLCPAP